MNLKPNSHVVEEMVSHVRVVGKLCSSENRINQTASFLSPPPLLLLPPSPLLENMTMESGAR